jgi:hypothetical protein
VEVHISEGDLMASALNRQWGGGFTCLLMPDFDKPFADRDNTMRERTKAVIATWHYLDKRMKNPVPKVGAQYWNLLIANGIVDG